MRSRRGVYILLAICALALLVRLYGLWSQPASTDERRFAFTAVHYVQDGQFGPSMWYHPKMRDVLVYASTNALGFGPIALRLPSLIFSVLSLPLLYMIVLRLAKDERAALISALMLSIEQVNITYSRQALGEPVTVFFILAGVLCAILYHKNGAHWALVCSGAMFGLGAASKFHALPPLVLLIVIFLYKSLKAGRPERAWFEFSCLVLLPFAVYMISYIPWFGRGYGVSEWFEMQGVLLEKMLSHAGNPNEVLSQPDIRAWKWFLMPTGYAEFLFHEGAPKITVAFSNPVVWTMVLPSFVYIAYIGVKRRDWGLMLLSSLFLISYAPLAIASRPVFVLSSLPVLPFAFALLSKAASDLAGNLGPKVLYAYLFLALAVSLALYPMSYGKTLEHGYLASIAQRFGPHR